MQEKDSQHIELGPGGLILNDEANEELLKKIREAKPLPPSDLLNLADFFRMYMTDVPLGDHLELVALRQMVYEPSVRRALVEAGYVVRSTPTLNEPDWLEDSIVPFVGDGGGDETTEPKVLRVEWISISGVGLLIEIVYYRAKDGNRKKRYYVIGVSPDPRSLQIDAQGRVSRVRHALPILEGMTSIDPTP